MTIDELKNYLKENLRITIEANTYRDFDDISKEITVRLWLSGLDEPIDFCSCGV